MNTIQRMRLEVIEGKRRYFREVLAPWIDQNGVLNARGLREENPKLHEEFRLAYRGIKRGCQEIGIYSSRAEWARKAVDAGGRRGDAGSL